MNIQSVTQQSPNFEARKPFNVKPIRSEKMGQIFGRFKSSSAQVPSQKTQGGFWALIGRLRCS